MVLPFHVDGDEAEPQGPWPDRYLGFEPGPDRGVAAQELWQVHTCFRDIIPYGCGWAGMGRLEGWSSICRNLEILIRSTGDILCQLLGSLAG